MMEKDEDIDIIDPYEGHQNSDSPPTFIIKSGIDENPQVSHHALHQAYEDMKRRHQQVKSQNEVLRQTIMDMKYSRQGNRTNSNMFGAAGPVGASPGADQEGRNAQFETQIGYAESVQRQLMRAQAKIIGPKNMQSSEKINTLNRDTQMFKSILSEKDKLIQQLEKQKDPNIMTEPFLVKIQELKAEMRDKDEQISALMERLKTVSKGYEQHKILHNDLMTMPESGYNTRMNEDQQLLTVEESKQILFEIEKHKKTLRHFLQQLKTQTETIHKQGQIIKEFKRQTGKTSKYFVMQQVFLRKGIKPHWWCNS